MVSIAAPLVLLLRGWVVAWLWRWFVVPLGLPPINAWQAAGVLLIVFFLKTDVPVRSRSASESADTAIASAIGVAVLFPLMWFGSAWIFKQLMDWAQ